MRSTWLRRRGSPVASFGVVTAKHPESRPLRVAIADKYKRIKLRVIELGAEKLEWPAKLNRGLVEHLIARGRSEAECFFDSRSHWPRERIAPARATFV